MKLVIVMLFLLFSFASSIQTNTKNEWWQHETVYEIVVTAFKDSNGDGIGDLAGIKSKLDYLDELGIRLIKLSSIYSSPNSISPHYGPDNFTDIHSSLGDMTDFDELISEAQARGIKIVLDIDFNHCHVTHEWFQKSIDGIEPYNNYFIWKDPVRVENSTVANPPNLWTLYTSTMNLVAWTWNAKRKQFYYSAYWPSSPDFNLRDEGLKEELKKIMKFWFDKGVSGFNIKDKDVYYEYEDVYSSSAEQYYPDEIYELLRQLREFVDMYNLNEEKFSHKRILITDDLACGATSLECYGNKDFSLVHFVSNQIIRYRTFRRTSTVSRLQRIIESDIRLAKEGTIFEWIVCYIFNKYLTIEMRIRPKYEYDFNSHLLYTITAILPGVWHLLYGSEIGLGGTYKKKKKCFEFHFNSEVITTPAMQWDDSKNAGFSDSNHVMYEPLPNYWKINVKKQKSDEFSPYHFFKDLLKLRQKESIKYGDINFYTVTETILAITRTYEEHETYIALINLANFSKILDLNVSSEPIPGLSSHLKVAVASPNFSYRKGDQINISRFTMRPYSSVVLVAHKSKH